MKRIFAKNYNFDFRQEGSGDECFVNTMEESAEDEYTKSNILNKSYAVHFYDMRKLHYDCNLCKK